MSTILLLITTFLVYLLVQALAINGIFISAAGITETLPDGTLAHSEMIFYRLYRYLNQSIEKKVAYSLDVIEQKTKVFPVISGAIINWNAGGPLFTVTPIPNQPFNIQPLTIWATTYLKGYVEFDATNQTIMIYQNIEFYRFSKWLRKPILTCIICMASFWSIFTFLIPVILIFGWSLKIIPIWIGNVFCLSYLNYLIFKPRK